ncbi:MAG: hypothetical protein ABIK37_04535 [candidate division WOR-3 bacterium]
MTVAEIVEWHLRRYPLLGAADVYKLLHQGAFGPGHAVGSLDTARQELLGEMASLQLDEDEEPEEPIDPDGVLTRVNLRPLVTDRTTAERLVAALVESAAAVKHDRSVLEERLAQATAWLRLSLPGLADELSQLAAEARVQGYPACRHSRLYRLNYRPAYRVVLARLRPQVRA